MRHFLKEKKFHVFFQENVLRFLSVRYSADFRRYRFVQPFSESVFEMFVTKELSSEQ